MIDPEVREFLREGCRCPVCGTPLSSAVQLCSRCDTPHHADCWDYLGGCAVFGCGDPRQRPGASSSSFRRPGGGIRMEVALWLLVFGIGIWTMLPEPYMSALMRWATQPSAARAQPPPFSMDRVGPGARTLFIR